MRKLRTLLFAPGSLGVRMNFPGFLGRKKLDSDY
jgi:hypothetical protein